MSSDSRPRTPPKTENNIHNRNNDRTVVNGKDPREKDLRDREPKDKNPPQNYRSNSKDLRDSREVRNDRDRERDHRTYRDNRRDHERSPNREHGRDSRDIRDNKDNRDKQRLSQTHQKYPSNVPFPNQPPPPNHPPPSHHSSQPPPPDNDEKKEKMEMINMHAPRKARWGSRSVDIFQKLEQIGEGTYGKVYMAKNKENNDIVALKKVRMANEKEGFPITAIREIKILKELHHENVVQLKEIVTSKATNKGKAGIYMVFEYMDHDLTGLMLNEGKQWKPSQAQIKCYMKQLLDGLHYCHSNNVLHRDIKGSNLLMDNDGRLKLADFGLARPYTEQQSNSYTNRVITLWYRPPELLLGAVQYGPSIDIWSAGCILAELLIGKAIFPGRSEIDELELIFKLCGTPNQEVWPDVDKLPWWHMFKPQKEIKRNISETLSKIASYPIPKEALELVDKMLALDPKKRITASEALDSDYFWTLPEPAKASQLPKYPSSHEYQAKKRRMQQQPQHQQQQQPIDGRDIKRQKGPSGAPVNYGNNSHPMNHQKPPYQNGPNSNNYNNRQQGFQQNNNRSMAPQSRNSMPPQQQRTKPPYNNTDINNRP